MFHVFEFESIFLFPMPPKESKEPTVAEAIANLKNYIDKVEKTPNTLFIRDWNKKPHAQVHSRFEYEGYRCLCLGPKLSADWERMNSPEWLARFGRPIGPKFSAQGYVNIPKGHILHGVHYDNLVLIECHGGLTYSRLEGDGTWTLGFDMMHYSEDPEYSFDVKVTADNLLKETKRMVDSIIACLPAIDKKNV